jgi:hypothetical protein
MKIHINNFNLDVLENIMYLFNDYLINCTTYIQICSISGIYQVTKLETNKLIPVDNYIKIIKNYYKDFDIIVDPSYYNVVKESTIEPNHISTKMKKHFYKINKNSSIQLIIESEIIDNKGFPYDIYFELPNDKDINDPLVKEEIIVFLSLLN